MASYSKRETAFDPGEQAWTVEPEGLRWSRADGATLGMAWARVREVRLAWAPTGPKPWRYTLTLVSPTAGAWTIDNGHYRGVGDFEDRSERFNPFVLACVAHVSAANPAARARLGAGPLAYWALIGFVAVAFAALAAALLLLPAPLKEPHWLKLGIVATLLPAGALFAVKSRPRTTALEVEAFRAALPAVPHDERAGEGGAPS